MNTLINCLRRTTRSSEIWMRTNLEPATLPMGSRTISVTLEMTHIGDNSVQNVSQVRHLFHDNFSNPLLARLYYSNCRLSQFPRYNLAAGVRLFCDNLPRNFATNPSDEILPRPTPTNSMNYFVHLVVFQNLDYLFIEIFMNHICKVHLEASIQILLMPLATVFTKFGVRWQCARSAAHTESEFQCSAFLSSHVSFCD